MYMPWLSVATDKGCTRVGLMYIAYNRNLHQIHIEVFQSICMFGRLTAPRHCFHMQVVFLARVTECYCHPF